MYGTWPKGCFSKYSGDLCSPFTKSTWWNSKGTCFSWSTMATRLVQVDLVLPKSLRTMVLIQTENWVLSKISKMKCRCEEQMYISYLVFISIRQSLVSLAIIHGCWRNSHDIGDLSCNSHRPGQIGCKMKCASTQHIQLVQYIDKGMCERHSFATECSVS